MSDYTHYTDISVDGRVSSSKQGSMIGSVSVEPGTPGGPVAADCAGCTVMYDGAFYTSDGISWTRQGGDVVWGDISGTLTDQTDLVSALDTAGHLNSATITVPVAGGDVTVTGMTDTAIVWVSPTPASIEVYSAAGCYCSAQSADTLTFTVGSTASETMDVNIVWKEP